MDPWEDDPDGHEFHRNCHKTVEEIHNRTGVSTGKNSKRIFCWYLSEIVLFMTSYQGYSSGPSFQDCACGVTDLLNRYNMHALVWMFIIPFIIIIFSYGNIASVIYNSTKGTSSHRERISSEAGSRFQKSGSSTSIDPRTKRLLLLIIALVVRYDFSRFCYHLSLGLFSEADYWLWLF